MKTIQGWLNKNLKVAYYDDERPKDPAEEVDESKITYSEYLGGQLASSWIFHILLAANVLERQRKEKSRKEKPLEEENEELVEESLQEVSNIIKGKEVKKYLAEALSIVDAHNLGKINPGENIER